MYNQAPSGDVDSQPITTGRILKVGVSIIGGSFLVLSSIFVVTPLLNTPSVTVAESTNLVSLASGARFRSPALSKEMSNVLGGPSPWKNLAITALKANERGSQMRDVSMMAAVKNADDKTKKSVSKMKDAVKWKAKELAGITEPMGFFDPLGFASPGTPDGKLLFYREVELKHGRLAMLASLGILVGENYHPLFGGNIDVPAIYAFQETPLQTFWPAVLLAIAIPEMYSVFTFENPENKRWWTMKDEGREPGDFNWDPLRLKPAMYQQFQELQNKELNNGRLAMIAAAGMIAQEMVTGGKLLPGTVSSFFASSAGLNTR
jgi:hypothetical protein